MFIFKIVIMVCSLYLSKSGGQSLFFLERIDPTKVFTDSILSGLCFKLHPAGKRKDETRFALGSSPL